MNAPPGDNLDFGEGSAAEKGERAFPGVLSAFKATYAARPHAAVELGFGISAYALEDPIATVFYARVNNKVAILSVKKAGLKLSADQLAYLGQLVAMLKKRGHR